MSGDPTPTAEDRRKAELLAQGMAEGMGRAGAAPGVVDLLAEALAVARNGGDVEEFLRSWARQR